MAYEGDLLNFCPVKAYSFSNVNAVVVSGSGPNACGHLILNLGGIGGQYLHVAGLYAQPRMMDQQGYDRYLKENGKQELQRQVVKIQNPQGAMLKLEELMNKNWIWGGVYHNCSSFVEEIVSAGGSKAGLYSNCPAFERFK